MVYSRLGTLAADLRSGVWPGPFQRCGVFPCLVLWLQTFGLEYDLDLFNIVAVDDFNMGAMENKSLNIFNSRHVTALGHGRQVPGH